MSSGAPTGALDLIVVGAGIFGSSVAREATRRGRRTLVLERGPIPNPISASFGPTRKIRSTYLEPHYAKLAREAMAAWREIEAELGIELYVPAGNLNFTGLDSQPKIDQLEAVAREVGSRVETLDQAQMRARFPQLKRARRGLLEPEAGFLWATKGLETVQGLARRNGATLLDRQEVLAIEPSGTGLEVRTADARYQAPAVVVAGGGWSNRLFPDFDGVLWQSQQGLAYVDGVGPELFRPQLTPFSCPDEGFYGFPAEPGVGFKVAQHAHGVPTDPDFDRATTPDGFKEGVARFLREDFGLNLEQHRVTFDSCMYNLSPSNDFLIDFHPRRPGVLLATAGSGHGFKFGSMFGKIVMDRLDGNDSGRWSPLFSFDTFLAVGGPQRML